MVSAPRAGSGGPEERIDVEKDDDEADIVCESGNGRRHQRG